MARKFKAPADPFAKIPKSEKEEYETYDEDRLNKKIASIAKDDQAMDEAKKQDEDLKKLKAQVSVANEPYAREKTKNKLRIKLLRRMLDDKGKPSGDGDLENKVEPAGENVARVDEAPAK